MAKELQSRPMAPLGEFVNCTVIGQSVAGRAESFKKNDNGEFVTLRPAVIRVKPGGDWHRYDALAFALSTDARFKLNEPRDRHKGQWLLFQLVDKENTGKGSPKKIFKVLILEEKEVAALQRRAIDKSEERALQIERAGGDPRNAPSIWGGDAPAPVDEEAAGVDAAADL